MNYHMSKSMLAEENGYRCIHVWDWDDWNKIAIELSSSLDVVDSRSCEVREIGIRDCNEFMENNHIDGSCRGDVCIGILFCGNIVSAMMFSKTKYSRDFELLRYCSSKHVDCGGELMLNLFKSKYEFDSIIVRCDRSKQNCNLYTDLGFELYSDSVAPNRHWYNMKTKMHIMDNDITDDVLRRLIGVNRDLQTIDAKTEDIMVNLGFVDVYDCGTSVYIIK